VRVSRIIAEYVLKLADSGDFDLDATSQFVVLVAALLEMKVPSASGGGRRGGSRGPRPRMRRRSAFWSALCATASSRNAGGALGDRWDEQRGRLYRNVAVPPALLSPAGPEGALPAQALRDGSCPVASRFRRCPTPAISADLAVSLVKEWGGPAG